MAAYKDIETVVRINPLNTEYGLKDLEAAVLRGGVDIVRLQKTDRPEDVYELETHVGHVLSASVVARLALRN